jgi:cellobiose-specific phosphotransferase system component IIC
MAIKKEVDVLNMKSVFMKILSLIVTGVCAYKVVNATDIKLLIFGSIVTACFIFFTAYLLFEEKVKEYLLCKFNKANSLYQLSTICFYTIGSYFLVFLFLYGTATDRNILILWRPSKYFFYFFLFFFIVASIYFTIMLAQCIIRMYSDKRGHP